MSLVLGVLGLDPTASLDLLSRVQAATHAERPSDHIRVIADINPAVPDLADPLAKPGPELAEMAGALRGAGAQVLAIANDAAHVHAALVERASGLPLIDMISAAAGAARDTGAIRAGVLGGRQANRLYREYLAAQGMGLVTLTSERQAEFGQALSRVRAGDRGAEAREALARFAADLAAAGAECVITGDSDVARVLAEFGLRAPVIHALDQLAQRCAAICLGVEPVPERL